MPGNFNDPRHDLNPAIRWVGLERFAEMRYWQQGFLNDLICFSRGEIGAQEILDYTVECVEAREVPPWKCQEPLPDRRFCECLGLPKGSAYQDAWAKLEAHADENEGGHR